MENKSFQNKILIFFLIFLSAVFGGGATVFGKIALFEIPPFSYTFLRFFIALIVLLPFSIKYLTKFQKQDYKIILLSLLASANVLLFAFGIRHTTADISQMIYVAVPIVSAIFSFYYLGEKFGSKKIFSIIIGFAGAALIIALPLVSGSDREVSSILGNFTIVAGMVFISLYWVLSKKFQDRYSLAEINFYFILTTAIMVLFLSIFDLFKNPHWYLEISSKALLSLLFVAVFSTAVYYLIFQVIIKKATPVLAGMILYVQPFATFVLAYYFLSETLSVLFIAGAVLTLLGIGLYNFSDKNLS